MGLIGAYACGVTPGVTASGGVASFAVSSACSKAWATTLDFTMISTRRLRARPASVALSATGSMSARPVGDRTSTVETHRLGVDAPRKLTACARKLPVARELRRVAIGRGSVYPMTPPWVLRLGTGYDHATGARCGRTPVWGLTTGCAGRIERRGASPTNAAASSAPPPSSRRRTSALPTTTPSACCGRLDRLLGRGDADAEQHRLVGDRLAAPAHLRAPASASAVALAGDAHAATTP